MPNEPRLTWPTKDPNETLTYSLVWSTLLGDDTIAAVDWTVPAGLTGGAEATVGYVTAISLSGGTIGTTYDVACKVTGASGQIYNRSPRLPVATR